MASTRCLGGRFFRSFLGSRGGFRSGFRIREGVEMLADFLRNGFVNGAGMGLLLGEANSGKQVNNSLGLDLELAGQVVNANLIGMRSHTQSN